MILGCVLAGGMSTRFGSDKALAEVGGQTLLERAVATLSAWCDAVVVAGRDEAPAPVIADWPRPGMGPLGGLAAALRHAQEQGFEAVLSCGVDSIDLPDNLPALLAPAPAYLSSQPVVGLWPVFAAGPLADLLGRDTRHSLVALAEAIGARPVKTPREPANINTTADLAAIARQLGETHDGL